MSSSKTFINSLNIYSGNLTYNDLDIDEKIPFEEQKWSYKMDIIQIEFGPRYTLDVGWEPELDPEGHFWVRGIQDCNWQKPLMSVRCRSLHELKQGIEKVAALLSLKNAS